MDNLSRDAARALAEGKTYGKWKAEHPNTKEDEIEIVDIHARKCDVCGKPVPRGSGYKLRCGQECSKIANRRRNSQRAKERKCQ